MEENKNNLSQIICQKCGLPLIIYSYKEIQDYNSEKIQIKLKCPNDEHSKANEIEFEEYYYLINNNPYKVCKCIICNNYLNNNEISLYCYDCKKIVCNDCLNTHKNQKKHNTIKKFSIKNNYLINNNNVINNNGNDISLKNDDFKNIDELISDLENHIFQIQKEMDNLYKLYKILDKKKKFLEFLKYNNNLYIFKDNNNSVNTYKNLFTASISNINKNINNYPINIIYHNGNDQKGLNIECENFRKVTKGSIILTNDLINLELVLKYIIKNNKKNKFSLIVNGRSAEKTITQINKTYKYRDLFINSFIFTGKKGNKDYLINLQNENKNFIKAIFTEPKELIQIINENYKNINAINEEFYINSIINENLFKEKYLNLVEELISHYGKKPPNIFLSNIKNFLKNSEYPEGIIKLLINKLEIFENYYNDYEEVIRNYLNEYYIIKIINHLLNKKEISIYKIIGYYAGNLMYSLIKYGKDKNKGVNEEKAFFCGLELNIIEMMEFLKNKQNKITFPYFFSMTTNEDLAIISSKRNRPVQERKIEELYSVIFTINYSPSKNIQPYIFEVKDLSPFPNEEEYILLPFTFLYLSCIDINSKEYYANIRLDILHVKSWNF